MTLIQPNDVLSLTAILFSLAWLGFLADGSRFGKTIPGVLCILVLGLLLSNTHVTPFSSPVGAFVNDYLVPAAIPLLMIKADLKRIFVESGRVMIGFAAACVGIVVGVLVGYFLLQPWHVQPKVAGFYAGAFIGGTISMVAVANALRMSASEFAAATGASMIPSVMGLMALIALPTLSVVRRFIPGREPERPGGDGAGAAALSGPPSLQLTHISGALALAFVICACARALGSLIGRLSGHDQSQYTILYVTALTVVVANLFPARLSRLKGEFELGMLFMYLFFGVIGLGTNITAFLDNAVSLFFYVIILLGVGIVICMLLSKLLKLDVAEAVTGCGAAIVGPAATVAVVAGKGWYSMISPAVMTGIFCHIVGNFVGLSVAALLR
ncbi:MAG TPA: DUF819 family protein [Steroidobacteraceae bacterium]|nr:DUF819 family protein [Steroidobacteraceae bacterium]